MLEDITSPLPGRRGSWGEGFSLRAQASLPVLGTEHGRLPTDRPLVVYQNVRRGSSDSSEVNELLGKARIVLPAIMNYLYFGSTQVAIVYFGKRMNRHGIKTGIKEGAHDLKIRLVRYFTAEMWPPLLRTDAPDESLGADILTERHPSTTATETREHSPDGTRPGNIEDSNSLTGMAAAQAQEVEQERRWFQRSVENHMQVLLYLKNATDGQSKYLKVVLQNSAHRLYFDVVDAREEKYRWDLRMLFSRMMDNLETQRAIDSYESYLEYFREACAVAAKNALFLERPKQPMLEVVLWTTGLKPPADACHFEDDDTGEETEHAVMPPPLLLPVPTKEFLPDAPRTTRNAEATAVRHVLQRQCSGGDGCGEWHTRRVLTPEEEDGKPGQLSRHAKAATTPSPVMSAAVTFLPPNRAAASNHPSPRLSHASLLSPTSIGARHSHTSRVRVYGWMSNLQKPESATLDYKSYFFKTASEVTHRCVKFMCGFLNAYGEGKLVVGVHEIPRTCNSGSCLNGCGGGGSPSPTVSRKEEGGRIVLHNDLVDQFVVGARVSVEELECMQVDVSEQLLCCIPPIPPRAVQVDAVPVHFPPHLAYADQVLILYDLAGPRALTRDALKQKSNYAIRFLFTLGLSIAPLDLPAEEVRTLLENANIAGKLGDALPPEDVEWASVNAEVYLVAAIDDPVVIETSDWAAKLSQSLCRHKQRCLHAILDYGPTVSKTLVLPELFVLEVSVDIRRCGYGPILKYKGKFFAGWPSIPVWDPTTRTVRAVERNYNVLAAAHPTTQLQHTLKRVQKERAQRAREIAIDDSGGVGTRMVTPTSATSPAFCGATATVVGQQATMPSAAVSSWAAAAASVAAAAAAAGGGRLLLEEVLTWVSLPTITSRVLAFLYHPQHIRDILQFRLIHPLTNFCFENRQGNYLVQMLYSTPVGVPIFNSPAEQLSRIQYSFLHAGIPPLPLLLCHCYETIGNLPSPYPYVAVPLIQQTFRVASCLVPLFYRQHYFDGQLRLAVVLDLRDSLLKKVELRNGSLVLDAVVGVGFEPMNRRQLMRHFLRSQQRQQHSRNGSVVGDATLGEKKKDEEDDEADGPDAVLLKESFIARRAFRPQALTHSTESHMGSMLLSPRSVEIMHATTEREVEADIPLLHFAFLSRADVQQRHYLSDDQLPHNWQRSQPQPSMLTTAGGLSSIDTTPSPHVSPTPSPTPPPAANSDTDSGDGTPIPHGCPWSLQHLLYWYNAFLSDRAHYGVFGCGHRSIAFHVSALSEVCAECVEDGAAEAVRTSCLLDVNKATCCDFAPSKEACTLHRKVREWLAV